MSVFQIDIFWKLWQLIYKVWSVAHTLSQFLQSWWTTVIKVISGGNSILICLNKGAHKYFFLKKEILWPLCDLKKWEVPVQRAIDNGG